MPAVEVPGDYLTHWVRFFGQVLKSGLDSGQFARVQTTPAIDDPFPKAGDGYQQSLEADVLHQRGPFFRRPICQLQKQGVDVVFLRFSMMAHLRH